MMEAPHAQHMSLLANLHRDHKKKPKPYIYKEFCMFLPPELSGGAKGRYANATIALIQMKLFPSWALFCYKELVANAGGEPPDLLCYMAPDAILLAPQEYDAGFKGLLIAQESSSGQIRDMVSPDGSVFRTEIPLIPTKIIAREGVYLQRV
jgi:hypothetical protein